MSMLLTMPSSSQPAVTALAAPERSEPAVSRRMWLSLAILLTGLFMALLDQTIVNVALQTIRTSLHADESTLAWVISGYALAFGVALIPSGRIGDRFGHKRIFLVGLAVFTLSSVACGTSQSTLQLIVARIFQGLGGGIFFPAMMGLTQVMFPKQALGRAFTYLGATIGCATALGPVTGGLLIKAFGSGDGWRSIFFVNLPIGVVVFIAAVLVLPSTALGKRLSTDLVGFLLSTGALVALLVPLIEGQNDGWPLWTYLSMAGSVVLFVAFAFWERHVARGTEEPLVPPHLFSNLSFTGGVVLALVYFAAFTGIFFTISLLWQAGLRHEAIAAGLVSVPFSIGTIIGASQSNKLAVRLGRVLLSIGTGLVAAGLIGVIIILHTVPTQSLVNWDLLGPLAVVGIGSGFFISPNTRFIVATVNPVEAGAASGVLSTMQRIGSAVGLAIVSSVLFGSLPNSYTPTKSALAQITRQHVQGGTAAVHQAIVDATYHNLAVGYGHAASNALAVSAGLAVAAFLLVFTLPRRVSLPGIPMPVSE
jgi:EmrB/QacA subfamily drug resistance transporter